MCEAEEECQLHNVAVSELTGFRGMGVKDTKAFSIKSHQETHHLSVWSETPTLELSALNILTWLQFTKAGDYDHVKLQVCNRLIYKNTHLEGYTFFSSTPFELRF